MSDTKTVDVRAVLNRAAQAAIEERDQNDDNNNKSAADGWEQLRADLRAASAAFTELVETAGKAQDTNRDDYALARPDVSHLPEDERAAFLRGWDAASEAVYRTGLRAAIRACGGAQ